jgi:Flp pilus assembly protein TadB
MTHRSAIFKGAGGGLLVVALAAAAVALTAFVLVTATPPIISIGAAVVVACGLTYVLVHRSHVARARAIGATYQSFGPMLARRRAEGQTTA